MTVGSLFTGVGGFDLGLERAGFEVLWQVEFDKQARSVLRRHWPGVDLYEDVCDAGCPDSVRLANGGNGTVVHSGDDPRPGPPALNDKGPSGIPGGGTDARRRSTLTPVDLICGGFPCQDVSVAGKRAGLAGERSGLWWEFHRIIGELAPTWVLIENVPGLLSSNEGRDMAVVLRGLEELGYGWAYRILDSQYFGVAQRRRRVFIVGRAGGLCPPEVLLEPEGVFGDTPPSREAGERTTGGVARSLTGQSNASHREDSDTYVACGFYVKGDGADGSEIAPTMRGLPNQGSSSMAVAHTLLTPTECERLQGFPDGWTEYGADITAKGKPFAVRLKDGPRYRMMGNAVTVDVAEWIGGRMTGGWPVYRGRKSESNQGGLKECMKRER